jgi:acetyltransferase
MIQTASVIEGSECGDGMAQDPYPAELDEWVTLDDGTRVRIRPLRPREEEPLRELFEHLSLRSRYLRFLSPLRSLPDSILRRLACVDYRRQLALVAEIETARQPEVVALGSFGALDDENAEVALVVRDDWQNRRIGTAVAIRIIAAAQARGFRRFIAHVAVGNLPIRRILAKLGDIVAATSSAGVSELAFEPRHRR